MSTPPPGRIDERDRAEIRDLASYFLAGELATSVSQTDESARHFADKATECSEEILAEVATERRPRDSLRRQVRALRLRQAGQLIAVVVTPVAATLTISETNIGPVVAVTIVVLSVIGVLAYATGLILGRRGERPSTEGSSGDAASLVEQLVLAESEYLAALRRAVLAWLNDEINEALGEVFALSLPDLDPDGLGEVEDPQREISTKSSDELDELIEGMPGGSIGIAGPRGAGKTTLIHRATRGHGGQEQRVAKSIVVDAPVEYDAREFILHLFSKLCETALEPRRVDELRGWNRRHFGFGRRWSFGASRRPYPPMLGPLVALAGLVLYVAIQDPAADVHLADLEPWALGAMAIGGLLSLASMALDPAAVRRWIRGLLPLGAQRNPTATAELRLRQIWFQQSFSSGWSGALKLPFGAEAGTEKSVQLAEKQLSLPDLVALYKEFVRMLAERGQVRIGIDELDKMDDERARRFLNEIKVIFRSTNCFYLVSVSEDAMSYFERRGLPFRDVFDSSFDEVLHVGYMTFEGSHRLLRRRVVGLPIQFVCLCHSLGGGLARDVIRTARDVCSHDEGSSIEQVVDAICTRQLDRKCKAAKVAMRRLSDPGHILLLSQWLRRLESASLETTGLLQMCRTFDQDFVEPLGPPPIGDPDRLAEHREALSIALELIAFSYFVATLRELLPMLDSEEKTQAATEDRVIDRLAEARQAFAVNPSEAWEAISAVRPEDPLHGEPIDFPPLTQLTATV